MLTGGGLLVHPTSAVYGIGGRPTPELEERIAELKGRAPGPLIRLVDSVETIREAHQGLGWDARADRLAERFWPGGLTLILDDGAGDGVAYRNEAHPAVRAVLRSAGGMMTSTSLNASGEPPAATLDEVVDVLTEIDFGRSPGGWLDVGDLPGGQPSTMVSLRGGGFEVLREGGISRSELEEALS